MKEFIIIYLDIACIFFITLFFKQKFEISRELKKLIEIYNSENDANLDIKDISIKISIWKNLIRSIFFPVTIICTIISRI